MGMFYGEIKKILASIFGDQGDNNMKVDKAAKKVEEVFSTSFGAPQQGGENRVPFQSREDLDESSEG